MAHDPPDDRRPQLRVSDEDRERTVLALRDGAAEGRLTSDELAGRAELAYTAVSREELERLVADLPVAPASSASPDRPDRKRRRWNIAVMGGHEYRPGSEPIRPGTPMVRVRGYALMGGLEVRVKRSSTSIGGGAQPQLGDGA